MFIEDQFKVYFQPKVAVESRGVWQRGRDIVTTLVGLGPAPCTDLRFTTRDGSFTNDRALVFLLAQRSEEVAIVTPDTIHAFGKLKCFLTFRVGFTFLAIALVLSERGKGKQADRQIVRTFMGQVIPVCVPPYFSTSGIHILA